MVDDKTIEFYSTCTPIEHRGQGLAARVVVQGLHHAAQNGLTVIPTCWYVKKILQRNPNLGLE